MDKTDISVIIPTCGRHQQLLQCLNALHKQDYPSHKIEVIVVDDRADEKTRALIEKFKTRFAQIRYIAQHRRGPAIARNRGVSIAIGRIIAFIDDDCVAEKDWVTKMISAHDGHPEKAAIGGDTLVASRRAHVLASQFLSTGSIEAVVAGTKEKIFFPTCNVSLKKKIFTEHAFNELFPLPGGEDLEFFWRLFKAGYRFVWDKDIKVTHYRSESIFSFMKQAYAYGRGNLIVKYLQPEHPLLHELKTGSFSFWAGTCLNFLKIPRFSYLLGKRLRKINNIKNIFSVVAINTAFVIHKCFYLLGNMMEYFRTNRHKPFSNNSACTNPSLLILDVTHKCDLQCRICDIWKTSGREKDLNAEYIKKLLKEAKQLNIPEIAFSGGEPLLRKDIFELFRYARDLNIKNLGVLTNGVAVEKKINQLQPYMIDNTISLVVSLDSMDARTHNFIRNSETAWQKTTQALKLISSIKEKYRNLQFHIITIILNRNLTELISLAHFAKSIGATSLQFQSLLPNNLNLAERTKSMFWVGEQDLSQLDAAIEGLIRIKRNDSHFIKNSENNLMLIKKYYRGNIGNKDISCKSAGKTVLVANQGLCTTCFSCYGNIRQSLLQEILAGHKRLKAQAKVKKCAWPCLLPCFCD